MRLIMFTLEGSFEELMKSQIMSVKPTEYAVMGKKTNGIRSQNSDSNFSSVTPSCMICFCDVNT